MIDLHSHVLSGVDDGVRTLDESLAFLRAAVDDGITHIAATPHVRDDYPTSPETMERGVAALNDAAREAGIPIEVLRGGELDLEFAAQLDDAALASWLTEDVPAAVVSGSDMPPRPSSVHRGRLARWRRP